MDSDLNCCDELKMNEQPLHLQVMAPTECNVQFSALKCPQMEFQLRICSPCLPMWHLWLILSFSRQQFRFSPKVASCNWSRKRKKNVFTLHEWNHGSAWSGSWPHILSDQTSLLKQATVQGRFHTCSASSRQQEKCDSLDQKCRISATAVSQCWIQIWFSPFCQWPVCKSWKKRDKQKCPIQNC